MSLIRQTYPSDVSDDEWALVAPYLTLVREDASQRAHPLRQVFNGLCYVVTTGAPWRWMPHELPPWAAVYQQAQRWLSAGCFEQLAEDLRAVLRLAVGRTAEPSVAILDSRTLRATPENGERAGYDEAKRKQGSKLHMAVDTLGHLLALHVTPANADDRAQVERLAKAVQVATDDSIEIAFVDQGYTGEKAPTAARKPCSCPGAGSSSAPSSGLPTSAGSSKITSSMPTRWQTCTSSPWFASCSERPPYSRPAHNSL